MNSAPYSSRAQRLLKPKRAKRAKRVVPPASMYPHRCVVLGVDPGAKSGWAIWCKDELLGFGEVDGTDYDAVSRVIAAALRFAELASIPCVLVTELPPTQHRKRSFVSLIGSGETRAAWRLAWQKQAGKRAKIVRLMPTQWRSRLGLPGGRTPREEVKRAEQRMADSVAKQHRRGGVIQAVGPESAPAILIGRCGIRAGEVALVLPQGARAA